MLIPAQASACTDYSQGAKSTWKCDAIFSNRIYFYYPTSGANEPIKIMCENNPLSLPVMQSAC